MRRLTTVAVALFLGCGGPPPIYTFDRAELIEDTAFDETWIAVIETMADMNAPITTLEKDSGIVGTDWIGMRQYRNQYMDCGRSGLNTHRNHQGRFNVFVESQSGGTRLTVNTLWQAYSSLGNNPGSWIQCNSKGAWEREFRAAVRSRLRN